LLPASMMILGAISGLRVPRTGGDRAVLLAVLCIGVYLAAILYLYLQIPNYSITKASYTAGLASCYGLLAARGYRIAGRRPVVGAILWAGLVAWAVSAWGTFFVIES
jgi:hypothetical protein